MEAIEQALLEGALAHGFATDVWTLDRIAVVIQGLTGVRCPTRDGGCCARLGWSVQRPQRQAKERDEDAIQHWVAHEWPRIKKGPRAESAWIVFFDESGISLIPPVRRTWSPRGHTPILRHRMAWKRASMAAALGYRPTAPRPGCASTCSPTPTTPTASSGCWNSSAFYAGQRVVLLWDGLAPIGATRCASTWMPTGLVDRERLPAYAPELNPVEFLWANLKEGRRAGQLHQRHHRRGRRPRPPGHPTRLRQRHPRGRVPRPHRPLPVRRTVTLT